VIDIRNIGLDRRHRDWSRGPESRPTAGAMQAFDDLPSTSGLLIRVTGDIIALSPPLIIDKAQVDQVVETIRAVLSGVE
jgi:beta-alanine--pyruvate transaminase